jgi:hypothetical protein
LGCQFRKVSYPTYLKTEVTERTEASLSNHQSGVRKEILRFLSMRLLTMLLLSMLLLSMLLLDILRKGKLR